MAEVKFPDVHVQLVGLDGNAYSIMGRTVGALRNGGATEDQIKQYTEEATSGDYNHLLRVTMDWVAQPDYEGEYDYDDGDWDDD